MTIDRKFWLRSFSNNSFPDWFCPRCYEGILKPIENGFQYGETGDTQRGIIDSGGSLRNSDRTFHYSVLLYCDKCGECVASGGTGFVDENMVRENGEIIFDAAGNPETDFTELFSPEFFYPPIHIFHISHQCPKEVKKEIIASFNLFFTNPSASANSVRKVIEKILDAEGITRSTKNGGFLRLDGKPGEPSRINFFEQKLTANNQETKIIEYFRAIKFIGNDGSHDDEITKGDVLDAYGILEKLILEDLYVKGRQKTENLAAKIVAAKKPLSKVKNSGN